MNIAIKIQSYSDIITNSSSEAFLLNSTKLLDEDLIYFNNAINQNHHCIGFLDEYLKNVPCDISYFLYLTNLSGKKLLNYCKRNKVSLIELTFEQLNEFLIKNKKTFDIFSKYILIFDGKYYGHKDNIVEFKKCINLYNSNSESIEKHILNF